MYVSMVLFSPTCVAQLLRKTLQSCNVCFGNAGLPINDPSCTKTIIELYSKNAIRKLTRLDTEFYYGLRVNQQS